MQEANNTHKLQFRLFNKEIGISGTLVFWLIIALASALRLYHLDFQSLWYDELHSMNGSDPDSTVAQVIEYSRTDQPPFYFLLMYGWFKIFPFSDFYGRLFAALAGIGGVAAMYLLGKEAKSQQTGWIAALLTAVNFFHLNYSQEVRFYSLLFLLATCSYYFFLRFVKRSRAVDLIGYVLTTSAAIYTHYYGAVLLLSQVFIFLVIQFWFGFSRKQFFSALASGILITLLVSPWIPQYLSDTKITGFWIEQARFPRFLAAYFYHYFENALLACLFAGLLVWLAFRTWKRGSIKSQLSIDVVVVLGWVFFGYGIPYAYSVLQSPIMVVRYTIIVMPAFLLAIAVAIDLLPSLWRRVMIVGVPVISIIILVFVDRYYSTIQKEQWREVATDVVNDQTDGSCIVFSYYAWHYNYYFKTLKSQQRVIHPESVDYEKELEKVNCVWLITAHDEGIGATNEEVNLIKRHFVLEKQVSYKAARGSLFRRVSQTNP